MKERLAETMRNMVRLTFGGAAELSVGASRFGGAPDVPADFIWPRFRTDTFEDDRVKERPLSFLAQFNCREMSAWDTEGLLPKTGLLAFFYECSSQRWGFDPADRGCARVFWFEDLESLQPAAFPADLPEAVDEDVHRGTRRTVRRSLRCRFRLFRRKRLRFGRFRRCFLRHDGELLRSLRFGGLLRLFDRLQFINRLFGRLRLREAARAQRQDQQDGKGKRCDAFHKITSKQIW